MVEDRRKRTIRHYREQLGIMGKRNSTIDRAKKEQA